MRSTVYVAFLSFVVVGVSAFSGGSQLMSRGARPHRFVFPRAMPLRATPEDSADEPMMEDLAPMDAVTDDLAPMGAVTEHYKRIEEKEQIMVKQTPRFSSAEVINGRVAMVGATFVLSREFLLDGESIPQQITEVIASVGQAAASWC